VQWEVTARVLAVAHAAHGGNDLWRRARAELEQLRDETEETVLLVVPDVHNFVVADVVESRQMLRVVLQIGTTVEAKRTATGRAMLPFLEVQRQMELLGGPPDRKLLEIYERTRELGYATSEGEVNPATTSLASALFDFVGRPIGAVVVCGPRERLTKNVQKKVGAAVMGAARHLSSGMLKR
jgi:IclR family acetate operon transcriptional repressor